MPTPEIVAYYEEQLRRNGHERPTTFVGTLTEVRGPLRSIPRFRLPQDDHNVIVVRRDDGVPELRLPPRALRAYVPTQPFPQPAPPALFVLPHPSTHRTYLVALDPGDASCRWVGPCRWLPCKTPRPTDDDWSRTSSRVRPRGRALPLSELVRRGWDAESLFRFHLYRAEIEEGGQPTLEEALGERERILAGLVRLGVSPIEAPHRFNAAVVRYLPCGAEPVPSDPLARDGGREAPERPA